MKLAVSLAAVVTLVLVACPPKPAPVAPSPDASDASIGLDAPPRVDGGVCALACARLAAAGCWLGTQGSCTEFLEEADDGGHLASAATGAPLTCDAVARIRSRADAQRLGFLCQETGP